MQALAIECLEGARSAGVALSAHVRSRGLELRPIYDAIAQLRRRGIVPAAPKRVQKRTGTAAAVVRFAKVEVRPAMTASMLRLRLTFANGRRAELEFDELEQLPRILAVLETAA
jgi:hypothetical protein